MDFTNTFYICVVFLYLSYLIYDFTLYYSDPLLVNVVNTATPAVEYTTRNLICMISRGNQSDPKGYHYDWMYNPTYHGAATYIPPPKGMC